MSPAPGLPVGLPAGLRLPLLPGHRALREAPLSPLACLLSPPGSFTAIGNKTNTHTNKQNNKKTRAQQMEATQRLLQTAPEAAKSYPLCFRCKVFLRQDTGLPSALAQGLTTCPFSQSFPQGLSPPCEGGLRVDHKEIPIVSDGQPC